MSEDIPSNSAWNKKVNCKRSDMEERDEDVYENVKRPRQPAMTEEQDVYCMAGDQHAESVPPNKRVYRASAVCLVLLCVLLLAGIIGLGLHHVIINADMTRAIDEKTRLVKNLTEEIDELLRENKMLCPKRWYHFNSSCYYLSARETTWEDSRQDCLKKRADLVIINSREENDFVHNFTERFWIGLTDIEVEGEWKWVDGSPLSDEHKFWGSSEPNGAIQENCVEHDNWKAEGVWNDLACNSTSRLRNWVCETANFL